MVCAPVNLLVAFVRPFLGVESAVLAVARNLCCWDQATTVLARWPILCSGVVVVSAAVSGPREEAQIEDAGQAARYHDVVPPKADRRAGHGMLRYTGLIAVSAPTVRELGDAVAAIEQCGVQACTRPRLLAGQRATVLTTAALPLFRRV